MKKIILYAAIGALVSACGGEEESVGEKGPYEDGVSIVYEYDALGRLVIYKVDDEIHTSYCLDAAGNRRQVVQDEMGCVDLAMIAP